MELAARFANLIAILAIIAGLSVVSWWLIGMYGVRDRKDDIELSEAELPSHVHAAGGRIPVVLILFFAFIAVSLIAYMMYIWLGRVTY